MDIGGLVGKLIRTAIGMAAIAVAAPSYGQFGNLRPITELNSVEGDSHAVVSRDNLRCFFATDRLSDPITRDRDVFYASRTTDAQPFVLQGPVPNINNAPYPDQPSFLSADERTLYLTTNVNDWDISTATRLTVLLPFSAPVPITELDDPDNQLNATVRFDGLELFLSISLTLGTM